MRLIAWNIQWGKGCDGVVDLARIVSTAMSLGDADVYCFQEVSDEFSSLDGGIDQSRQLAALLPDHLPVFRPAVETIDGEGKVHRFGNMTLSRLPVLQVAGHLLPWPRAGEPRSMRRLALEVTVQASFAPVRIVNTHLEYYSAAQREAQLVRLLDLQEEASRDPNRPRPAMPSLMEARPWQPPACCAAISISMCPIRSMRCCTRRRGRASITAMHGQSVIRTGRIRYTYERRRKLILLIDTNPVAMLPHFHSIKADLKMELDRIGFKQVWLVGPEQTFEMSSSRE
jgi:endonuclease/exonuclease/phosphatase family metal-dependent hydrolase